VIDIHCHILPEVDDGPKSWETAEAICKMATADGITHMVATPHANDRYHYDRAYLTQLLAMLQERIGPSPSLDLGCDFHLSFENMASALATPERYCIGTSHYLLVELSNFSIPEQIDDWLAQMHEKGITCIVTHPERNPILQQNTARVLRWIKLGCAVQITASALTGGWGERAGEIAKWLLRQNAVHFIATDAHNTQRRPPILSEARKVVVREFGEDLATALVETNPTAVIRDAALS
jgi:protein-tyrosine phosphatase